MGFYLCFDGFRLDLCYTIVLFCGLYIGVNLLKGRIWAEGGRIGCCGRYLGLRKSKTELEKIT
jgi:hypothetical protein